MRVAFEDLTFITDCGILSTGTITKIGEVMLQTARCETDLTTTKKVATAVDEPMRVWVGDSKGEVCCPCGNVTGLNSKGQWPHLKRCEKCRGDQSEIQW